MINQFPEIVFFFKKNQFTNVEFEDFISKLEKLYPQKDILKKAKELIKLELLKFKLLENEIYNNPKKDYISKDLIINDINILIGHEILKIAKILNVNSSLLLKILKDNNILCSQNDIIDDRILKCLEKYIIGRLNYQTWKRNKIDKTKKQEVYEKINSKTSYYSGVWGLIRKYDSPVIFVRSRYY